jgi:hypothetical protein
MTYMLRKIERLTAQREAAKTEAVEEEGKKTEGPPRGLSTVSTQSESDMAASPSAASATSSDCSDDEDCQTGARARYDVEDIVYSGACATSRR